MDQLHIGTSGWSYKEWKGIFYPEKLKPSAYLSYYSTVFDALEINTSFYHLPREQTVRNWGESVPDGFFICPKLSRVISHYKKLHDAAEPLCRFFDVFDILHSKLGPVLIQLPAQVRYQQDVAETFFGLISTQYKSYDFAIEIRHDSWLSKESIALLKQHNISLVIAQSGMPYPYHEFVTAQNIYLRFHGPEKLYASSYDDATLKAYAKKCQDWISAGHTIWAFFNNTMTGQAIDNAKRLKQLIMQ